MSHAALRKDLLLTKLHPPPQREKQVARWHLLKKLDAALHQRLTLVCAPAGYGKTTLISQWVKRHGESTGWVTLDRGDNDLVQFLRYFVTALQQVAPGIGSPILETLPALQPLPGPAVWLPLINAIAAEENDFVVILDDYHEVEEQAVHTALDYLIDHMPNNLHLILASRADPPLALPRLRARGYLTELRLNDLRFSSEEITDFLNNVMALGLTKQDTAALERRTEGWIASLQMAALSLQMHSADLASRSAHIQSFTGSHRFILDYLLEEVLALQPAPLQDFLLKTSILERLSSALCDAVIGDEAGNSKAPLENTHLAGGSITGSQTALEHLESANLFLFPLDDERRWYRYHRLFADLLQKRLWQMSPELMPTLHLRASHWYEQQGFASEAIQHALAAKAFDRAATLIENHVEATLMRSEVKTFLNWIEKLPEEYLHLHARLAFYHTWALLMSGQSLREVEQRLQGIASIQDAAESSGWQAGRLAALRAYLMLFQAEFDQAVQFCQQALEYLPEGDLFLRNLVTWILGMIHLSDDLVQDGRQALDRVIRQSQEIGNPLIAVAALSHQARFQMRQGRLPRAQETLEQALALATDSQGRRLPVASEALIGLGDLEREWNHLDKAAEYLTESIELAKQWNELSSFDAYLPLMRLRWAQGDPAAAREAVETACQMARNSDFSQIDDILADLQQAIYYLLQGNAAEAIRWAEKHGLSPGMAPEQDTVLGGQHEYVQSHIRKYAQLVLARALVLQGRAAEALPLLEMLHSQAVQLARVDLAIEIHILRSLAYQHGGKDHLACAALAEALALAEPGGYVRIFLDEGGPMIRLLRQAASRGIAPAYVARLLAEYSPSTVEKEVHQPSAPIFLLEEPLSDRELAVLRLLANGLSNPEIASELCIAVSTVRTHCKNIYGKLGVHRRGEAAQRARALGLF